MQKGWMLFLPEQSFVFCGFGCCEAIWRCQLADARLPSRVSRGDQVTPANPSLYKAASVLQVALEVLMFACDGLNGLWRACPRSLSFQVTQQHSLTSKSSGLGTSGSLGGGWQPQLLNKLSRRNELRIWQGLPETGDLDLLEEMRSNLILSTCNLRMTLRF